MYINLNSWLNYIQLSQKNIFSKRKKYRLIIYEIFPVAAKSRCTDYKFDDSWPNQIELSCWKCTILSNYGVHPKVIKIFKGMKIFIQISTLNVIKRQPFGHPSTEELCEGIRKILKCLKNNVTFKIINFYIQSLTDVWAHENEKKRRMPCIWFFKF